MVRTTPDSKVPEAGEMPSAWTLFARDAKNINGTVADDVEKKNESSITETLTPAETRLDILYLLK